jgi:hypothetical protein
MLLEEILKLGVKHTTIDSVKDASETAIKIIYNNRNLTSELNRIQVPN